MLAHLLGAPELEERQRERGVGAPRRLHDDPGQTEGPGEERPGELDRLHALEPHLAVLPEEHALAELDLPPTDPEPREAPAHPVDEGHDREEGHDDREREHRVPDGLLDGALRADTVGEPLLPRVDRAEPDRRQHLVEQLRRGIARGWR